MKTVYRNNMETLATEPDWGIFGIDFKDGGDPAYFMLEAECGTEAQYRRRQPELTSIHKKLTAYYLWHRREARYGKDFNVPNLRILWVTNVRGARIPNMIAENKRVQGDKGSTIFLFAYVKDLLEHPDIFRAPWRNGQGELTYLAE